MIKLINGRGQLGSELIKYSKDYDCVIYHTWNIEDHSSKKQFNEFEKLKKYLENDYNLKQDGRFVFISTIREEFDAYSEYKLKSELYILNNVSNALVIKIPKLIGKGVCEKFADGELPQSDNVELMSIFNAAKGILNNVDSHRQVVWLHGELISKQMVYDLIQFGVKIMAGTTIE